MALGSDRPVYVISIAAELAGMHPQTLRQYDRMGLVEPSRAPGVPAHDGAQKISAQFELSLIHI